MQTSFYRYHKGYELDKFGCFTNSRYFCTQNKSEPELTPQQILQNFCHTHRPSCFTISVILIGPHADSTGSCRDDLHPSRPHSSLLTKRPVPITSLDSLSHLISGFNVALYRSIQRRTIFPDSVSRFIARFSVALYFRIPCRTLSLDSASQ